MPIAILEAMMRPFIVVGDRTSHGGVVISGSETTDIDGKPVARIGDQVTCPRNGHGSVTTIVTGDLTAIIDGRPLARHGDKTACGATLISSQMLAYVDVGNSSDQAATSVPATTSSLLAGNQDSASKPYDEQTKLLAPPIEGVSYFIKTQDGRSFSGRVGKDGLLPRVDTNSEEDYEVYWGDEALAKMTGDSE